MIVILTIIAFALTYWWLMRRLQNPPTVMTEEQLRQEGLTERQIRSELRAQRSELRSHTNTTAHTLRTANQVSRLTRSILRSKR